jgi:thiamine-phosphate pyrophosphorylase
LHEAVSQQVAALKVSWCAVLGPIFDTPSKRIYGKPIGLEKLKEVSETLSPFPIIAIGGIDLENTKEVFENGARGIAAIRLLNNRANLHDIVQSIKACLGSGVWSLES